MERYVKNELLKELYILVRDLNKIYKKLGDSIFEACNKFITKVTDYSFMILDEGTASLGNV